MAALGMTAIQQTGPSGDDNRRTRFPAVGYRGFYQRNEGRYIVGVSDFAESDAASLNQFFDMNRDGGFSGDALCAGRRRLVAGHGGGAVIQNDENEADILGDGIDQGGNSGMKKCGIPQRRHDIRPLGLMFERLIKPCRLSDGGAHTDEGIDRS